ncbi:MAG: VWA domain-containing protein, partial [Planctomycetota bacterium]|nr:VWA domain-containing protein [Planctomycetota bacterium]
YHRLTDYLIPLATAKYTTRPIEELNIQIRLESSEKLKTIYSPTFPLDVTRAGKRTATIKVHQKQCLPASDFRLLFDTSGQAIGASLLTHWPKDDDEGYFMLLASPEVKQNRQDALPKDIIFVVDRSGSMTGKKIDQVKDSLRFVVNQLSQGDRFDIVSYSTDIEIFKPRLQAFNEETRQQALGYIEGLYAGGSTNISGALEAAFDLLQKSDRPQYVVFLTDGLPTAGVTQEAKIVEQTRETNQSRARLLSLGVGYDVNSRLLDRLTRANRGQSEYVRPDENIESYIGRLYGRIASPVLTDVSIEFLKTEDRLITANLVNRLYPRELPDLFQGEQLVVAGRYTQAGAVTVRIQGKVNTEAASFEFPLNLQ